jgi:hypothetical protein
VDVSDFFCRLVVVDLNKNRQNNFIFNKTVDKELNRERERKRCREERDGTVSGSRLLFCKRE